MTRNIVERGPLKAYSPEELKPGVVLQNDDELIQAAAEIGTTIFHPVGTCKMGAPKDSMSVLDANLFVKGIHGLRVVDAS